MMQTPIREKTKAFCAIVAAITGASLIVFTAMASYYGSAMKDADTRYREALRQLQLERSLTQEDVKGIIIRLSALEKTVAKAHPKD